MKNYLFLIALSLIFSCCQNNGIKNKDYKRKYDNEFVNSSKVYISEIDSQTVENLVALCKVWGYLKYYHPDVADGKYNWDFELFRIMSLVLESKSTSRRNEILYNWINSLGKVKESNEFMNTPSDSIKMYPGIDWIEDKSVLGNVSKQLRKIKNAQRRDENYYVTLNEQIGNPAFLNEKSYARFAYPDTGYRLLALFRFWNVIQYYFPYKYLINENWEDVLWEFIPQFIHAKNKLEYRLALMRLVARIHDTHAVIGHDPLIEEYKGTNIVPAKVEFIEGKAVIANLYLHNKEKISLKRGDIVLRINNESVDAIVQKRLLYISASNSSVLLRDIAPDLLRTNADKLLIEYERNNKILRDSVVCNPIGKVAIPQNIQQHKPLYQEMDSICYLYLGSTIGGTIPDSINSKGIIIDLRCYPSSQVEGYWEFSQLYSMTMEFCKITYRSIQYPGLFMFTPAFKVGNHNDNYYKGKIIILVNEVTQSHAEFMAMKYRCIGALVIGSTTAGADGNVSRLMLPGGIEVSFTGIGVYYPDDRETQRVGIIPDIEVKPTIKGILEGRDEVLERAIQVIQGS